jgi:poly-gamma-glutamate synthesis protein (capsule biosynthesis protein)
MLWERYIEDAQRYVELAEAASGPIPRPVDFSWPWGDALQILDEAGPDARVVNLETSIIRSGDADRGKPVHYRMSPDNAPVLAAARLDICTLANNHVLDFGRRGLEETLDALARARIRAVGAGRDEAEAQRPAVVPVDSGRRILVFSFGTASSGVPPSWAATRGRAGVDYLPDLSDATADGVTDRLHSAKLAGDVAVAAIHWGSNWGYDVSSDQVRFAHRLVDGGADIIHGHSSHHPRPIELYRGRLVLYGCGDLIDDYEAISGHEKYHDELRLLYLASLDPNTGRLVRLRMVPMSARQMRLARAGPDDCRWVRDTLDQVSRPFGTRIRLDAEGMLTLRPS